MAARARPRFGGFHQRAAGASAAPRDRDLRDVRVLFAGEEVALAHDVGEADRLTVLVVRDEERFVRTARAQRLAQNAGRAFDHLVTGVAAGDPVLDEARDERDDEVFILRSRLADRHLTSGRTFDGVYGMRPRTKVATAQITIATHGSRLGERSSRTCAVSTRANMTRTILK